jgi:hypothetical protein
MAGKTPCAAVRIGDLKAVLDGSKRCQFYDLTADPREARDLFGRADASRFAALDTALADFLARPNVATNNVTGTLDPRLLQQLKSLGYVK